jgi:hypothetical protein
MGLRKEWRNGHKKMVPTLRLKKKRRRDRHETCENWKKKKTMRQHCVTCSHAKGDVWSLYRGRATCNIQYTVVDTLLKTSRMQDAWTRRHQRRHGRAQTHMHANEFFFSHLHCFPVVVLFSRSWILIHAIVFPVRRPRYWTRTHSLLR